VHGVEVFGLSVRLGEADIPALASITLQKEIRDDSGRLRLTTECASLDEIEGQINALQDELDQLRAQARRVFQMVV
jgi:uncharacterized small protein (DUF1192 family)